MPKHTTKLSTTKGGEIKVSSLGGGALSGKFNKGSMSKTHKGEKDFTTKKSSKDFHRGGHDEKEKHSPFSKHSRSHTHGGGEIKVASLSGGGFHKGSMSKTHKGEKDFTTKKGDKDFHEGGHDEKKHRDPFHNSLGVKVAEAQHTNPAPRELQNEMNRMATKGREERGTLDTTRDALLMGIINRLDASRTTDENHTHQGTHSKTHSGEGIKTASLEGGRLRNTLANIVKNKRRLNHLEEMGINLKSYSPYVVKAVVDGDYRSYRTTNKHEWDRMVNECALKGVQVNVMGAKTQFGRNLQGFLTNGKYGGELSNTDLSRNAMIDPPSSEAVVVGHGLEASGDLEPEPEPVERTPDKDTITTQIIHLSVNTGYNVALDLLNSVKGMYSPEEYADLYAYLGQNSLPLR
jgi:hypothetical protein